METTGEREIKVIMLRLQSGLQLDLFVRLEGRGIGSKNFKVTGKIGGCPRYKIRSGRRTKEEGGERGSRGDPE